MSKGGFLGLIIFLALAGMLFWYISTIPTESSVLPPSNINTQIQSLTSGLTIASWNLQIFGQDKASDAALLAKYASIIGKYDIVFVQEIRDISETSFDKLCALLPDYSCLSTSRAGRTNSKESFGMIYRKGVIVLEFTDYNNPTYQQYFERPPLKSIIQISEVYGQGSIVKNLTIWGNHLKPEDVTNEMNYLEQIVKRDSDINQPFIVLGDLNFDCDYANHDVFKPFNGYFWIIPDDADTTVGSNSCAYDRFIANFEAVEYGIDTSITKDLSDHYLIYLKI